MAEEMTALALSMYSAKGAYALLLGSGISSSAEIMTGWGITLDLIRKLAAVQGDNCGDKPDAWYATKYKKEPDYSDLLEVLARTSAERQLMLRSYFEPNHEEAEQGKKKPTSAHRAITQLVVERYIKVIVTTNFDRLLETALGAAGVHPTVIASPDAIQGALPLHLDCCTIIKVHGDYLDTRLRNTRAELEKYEPSMDQLLDRVFQEYGLIVCGWSAEWDTALREAVRRNNAGRFSTFWSSLRPLAGRAQEVSDQRRAHVIPGITADSFFDALASKVAALAEMSRNRPISPQLAVAELKRFVAEKRYRVRLHDLVTGETDKVLAATTGPRFAPETCRGTDEEILDRAKGYDGALAVLLPLMVAGGFWGQKAHRATWIQSLERLARPAAHMGGNHEAAVFSLYPVITLFYACGVAAVAAGRPLTLAGLLTRPTVTILNREYPLHTAMGSFWSNRMMVKAAWDNVRDTRYKEARISTLLFQNLESHFEDYVGGTKQFQKSFERFEYLVEIARELQVQTPRRYIYVRGWESLFPAVTQEIEAQRERWPPIRYGAIRGTIEEVLQAKRRIDERLTMHAMHMGWCE